MKSDEMFQVFKEIYYFEIEHKYKIDSSLNLPTNSLLLIMPAAIYIYKDYIKLNPILSIIIFSLISGFFIMSLYYLLRTYIGHKYSFLPDYDKLYEQLIEISTNDNKDIIYDELIKQYITHAEPNKKVNLKRLKLLFKCKLCIWLSLVFLVLLSLFYFKEI